MVISYKYFFYINCVFLIFIYLFFNSYNLISWFGCSDHPNKPSPLSRSRLLSSSLFISLSCSRSLGLFHKCSTSTKTLFKTLESVSVTLSISISLISKASVSSKTLQPLLFFAPSLSLSIFSRCFATPDGRKQARSARRSHLYQALRSVLDRYR